jgi:uncharacterized membrane protein YraQ (UPF0718 family)
MNQGNNVSMFMRFVTLTRPWLFPLGVVCLYGLGMVFAPERTDHALHKSGAMVWHLAWPICLALIMMVVLNRFLSPAMVTRFLGQSASIKGIFLSSLAGILSMGPVYAWYPLLKKLKDNGASQFHIANFIGNRSIKPVLLPILVISWGGYFAALFVLASFIGAFIVAWIVRLSCADSSHPKK